MQIGIVGSWEPDLDVEILRIAEDVGKEIAQRGDIVFTGGSTGIMEAAMRGAKSEGGTTVGIIPAEKKAAYACLGQFIDIFILTGMGEYGRLAPLIHSVDGIIAIAGGAGTLIEISMAYLQGKPVISIPVSGFTSERVQGMLQDLCLDHRKIRPIRFAENAHMAVDLLYASLEEGQ